MATAWVDGSWERRRVRLRLHCGLRQSGTQVSDAVAIVGILPDAQFSDTVITLEDDGIGSRFHHNLMYISH